MFGKELPQVADFDIGHDLPGWRLDNAGPLLCGRDQRVEAICPEPGRYTDFAFRRAAFHEAPAGRKARVRPLRSPKTELASL
jgi:hypothetical protein